MRLVWALLFVLITFSASSKNPNKENACPLSASVPLLEDFSTGVPPSNWEVNNPDGSEGWELTTAVGSDGNSTEVARMDNYQYNSPGQLDDLVMPSVDISAYTNPKLIFDVAYAPYGATNYERLHIEYSTDCGTNYTATTYDKSHLDLATVSYQTNGWGPQAASDWRTDTLDLSAYSSTQTTLKFVQTAGFGNGLFIDNVRVEPSDAPTANFSSNLTVACLTETFTFTDLSTEGPTAWAWSFSPSTITYQNGTDANSQNPQVAFDAIGTYVVTLTATNLIGSSSSTQTIGIVGSASVPLSEDFSAGVPPSNWVVINPDGSKGWELTTAVGIDGNSTQMARMDNYQYNSPGQLDGLAMPSVDISSYSNPKLIFDVAYAPYGATNYERLHIEYSTDCGTNFSTTTYDKSHLDLATVSYQTTGWEPSSASDWRTDTLDLLAYSSAQTILKFVQTAGYGNGLFIDNVRLELDAPTANFSASPTVACLSETFTFTDLSSEGPTAWAWNFSPSTVTYQSGTDANSQHPQVTFDASGTYTVTLTATNPAGSNSSTQTIGIFGSASVPLSEGFSSAVPPVEWLVINPDDSKGWEMTTTVGIDGNSTQAARMDNYQYNSPGQLDDLVIPSVDISSYSNPKLIFDVAYAPLGASNFERLHIEYSTDCGTNFSTTSYDKSHLDLATVGYQTTGWEPSSASDWRTDTLDLSAYTSAQTILKFVQTAGYGNGLFIDNVRISIDPPVAGFSYSPSVACLEETFTFTDLSTGEPTAWDWSFSPSTVTFQNGTTASSQHPQLSFDASGEYEVTLTATNIGGSSSTTQSVIVYGMASAPLLEGFTAGVPPTNWLVINPDGDEGWETILTTGSDGSLTQLARMNNYNYNAPGQLDDLILPSVDISTLSSPKLYFDVAYAPLDGSNFERLQVMYSTDCGANFSTSSYDKSSAFLATVGNQSTSWQPTSASDWRTDSLDLSMFLGSSSLLLKFVQTNGNGNGLFIDNVRIGDNNNDILSSSITVLLEGSYSNGLMNTSLASNNLIPLAEPYTVMGWHNGTETTTASVLSTYPVVDWVLVELRDKTNNTVVIEAQSCLLLEDGSIVGTNGINPLIWSVSTDNYYVVVRHRNHLAIMTLNPIAISISTSLDLRTESLYGGTNASTTVDGVQALIAGNASSEGYINAVDRSLIWNNRNQTNYTPYDCDLDGSVNAGDISPAWNNRNRWSFVP